MNYIKRILAEPNIYTKFETPLPFKKVLIGTNGGNAAISLEKDSDVMFLGGNTASQCIEVEFPSTINHFYFYNSAETKTSYSVLVEEWGN